VTQQQLLDALSNLPSVGELVKDRGNRQVWRVQLGATPYFLKWYPRAGNAIKRKLVGNPALLEFTRLIALQQAAIASPRAIAVLRGFKINSVPGDAVILQAIEPSVPLDKYLNDLELRGEPVPDRPLLARQLIDLIYHLGKAKLGHNDLHLGNILLSQGKLFLLDGYAVRNGGLKMSHVLMLGHSAGRWATRTEMVRGWRLLMASDSRPPSANPVSEEMSRKFLDRTRGGNAYFGIIKLDDLHGRFFKRVKAPRWWSPVSELQITEADWISQWPIIREKLQREEYPAIKRSASGDVFEGTIQLAGRDIDVIFKLPKRKTFIKRVSSFFRSKNSRSWTKAWKVMIRNFPVEWPLLLAEKTIVGYPLRTLLILARVPGPTLEEADLDSMPPVDRERFFRRLGRTLRRLELAGFGHFDAKSSNWIVLADERRGPTPVIIDVDGIRHYRTDGEGIERLLRSMKLHRQYTRQDSYWLCKGYAPFARVLDETTQTAEGQ